MASQTGGEIRKATEGAAAADFDISDSDEIRPLEWNHDASLPMPHCITAFFAALDRTEWRPHSTRSVDISASIHQSKIPRPQAELVSPHRRRQSNCSRAWHADQ